MLTVDLNTTTLYISLNIICLIIYIRDLSIINIQIYINNIDLIISV